MSAVYRLPTGTDIIELVRQLHEHVDPIRRSVAINDLGTVVAAFLACKTGWPVTDALHQYVPGATLKAFRKRPAIRTLLLGQTDELDFRTVLNMAIEVVLMADKLPQPDERRDAKTLPPEIKARMGRRVLQGSAAQREPWLPQEVDLYAPDEPVKALNQAAPAALKNHAARLHHGASVRLIAAVDSDGPVAVVRAHGQPIEREIRRILDDAGAFLLGSDEGLGGRFGPSDPTLSVVWQSEPLGRFLSALAPSEKAKIATLAGAPSAAWLDQPMFLKGEPIQ